MVLRIFVKCCLLACSPVLSFTWDGISKQADFYSFFVALISARFYAFYVPMGAGVNIRFSTYICILMIRFKLSA